MREDALYKQIINSLEEGIYYVNAERRITMWNHSAEKITGYKSAEIIGRHCHDNILSHIDMKGKPLCMIGCPLFEAMGDGSTHQAEVILRHKDGHRIAVLAKVLPIYDGAEVVGAVEIFTPLSNVVGSSTLVDSLTHMIMTDSLTGLPNRMALDSNLNHKIDQYKRFGRLYCVMMIDIDDFRVFNNTYGHQVGDIVLKSIASSLSANTREADTIGRWGGEEFLGLFSIGFANEAYEIADKIRLLVENSEILHGDVRINVTCSIGVAVANPGDAPEDIVRRADKLMYLSKQRGKNCINTDCSEPSMATISYNNSDCTCCHDTRTNKVNV